MDEVKWEMKWYHYLIGIVFSLTGLALCAAFACGILLHMLYSYVMW